MQYDHRMSRDRLFTPRFFLMCGFTFTVFLSAFQLLPTAPFHIIDLGGSTFASGLFLGFLTYASAFSAPLTGAYADRIGHRRMLLISSIALAGFSALYAVITNYRLMLALAIVQGIFWSGLLSASAAYMTQMLPERRRAEGIGYWGLSTMAALAVAPSVGFVHLPLRLGVAVRARRRAEPRHARHRHQPAGAAARPASTSRTSPARCSSGACSSRR